VGEEVRLHFSPPFSVQELPAVLPLPPRRWTIFTASLSPGRLLLSGAVGKDPLFWRLRTALRKPFFSLFDTGGYCFSLLRAGSPFRFFLILGLFPLVPTPPKLSSSSFLFCKVGLHDEDLSPVYP